MAETKRTGAKNLLTGIHRKIGSMLGPTKRKDPSVYDSWDELCAGNKWNRTDRLLDFMKLDLQNNGIDLAQVRISEKSAEMQGAFDDVSLATDISNMARMFAKERMASSYEQIKDYGIMEKNFKVQMSNFVKEMKSDKPAPMFIPQQPMPTERGWQHNPQANIVMAQAQPPQAAQAEKPVAQAPTVPKPAPMSADEKDALIGEHMPPAPKPEKKKGE